MKIDSTIRETLRVKSAPIAFPHDFFNHELLERQGDIAIYRKTKPSTGYVGYEVVKITLRPLHPFDPDKELYDRVEHYPSSAEWGTYGWTCQTLKEANAKVAALDGLHGVGSRRRADIPRSTG